MEDIGKAFGKQQQQQPTTTNDKNNVDNGKAAAAAAAEDYGPLGILAVQGIPQFAALRQRLLPLAARLPTLPDLQETLVLPETLYSTGWSHGKEIFGHNGKPDLAKGSFYANPLHDSLVQAMIQRRHEQNSSRSDKNDDNDNTFVQELQVQAARHPEFYADNVWPERSLPELRDSFIELGRCMVKTGRLVAAVCDAYCRRAQQQQQQQQRSDDDDDGGGGDNGDSSNSPPVSLQLCQTLTESLNCKGRLLHYFPVVQQDVSSCATTTDDMDEEEEEEEHLWCGWHNDHVS
jgi:hypothetical protein